MASILIVEDEQELAELMKLELERRRHDVRVVGNGLEAISMVRILPPDVLILDINLPTMSGLDLLDTLSKQGRLLLCKVIMISAYGDADKVRHALSKGCVAFLVKPFTPQALTEKVEIAIGARRANE